MASHCVQGGTTLYRMTQAGVPTTITLPSGVTLTGPTVPCRAAVFGSGGSPVIVVVGGGTHDFWVDTYGTARRLQVEAPVSAPTLTPGLGVGLYGTYAVACTNKVKDSNGMTLMESGFGPLSLYSASLVNASLRMDNLPISTNAAVNARGIYRTTAGGNVLYPWFDLDNNIAVADDRAGSDALLSLIPGNADTFSAPPDFKLITVWKDRLWAVPRVRYDAVRYTEERLLYAWNPANEIIAPPQYTDPTGVTAFIPRRDQLGIARSDRFYQITGDGNDSFARLEVSKTLGCVSQDSVVVVRDIAYFLSDRGVVEWTSGHLGLVSEAQVDPWFTSDETFNRALFSKAQGRYNRDTDSYDLLLASAGSSVLDSWVSFDLQGRRWFGPHKTAGFVPTVTGQATDASGEWHGANSSHRTVFGSANGYFFARDEDTANDGTAPVAFLVKLPFLSTDPDRETFWGELSIHTRQEDGGTLTITPIVGDLEDDALDPLLHDLSLGRERLERLGQGRYMQLTLSHEEVDEFVRLYELSLPYYTVGRR